jgi:hypothetical protein
MRLAEARHAEQQRNSPFIDTAPFTERTLFTDSILVPKQKHSTFPARRMVRMSERGTIAGKSD